jgi:hypothetical protein
MQSMPQGLGAGYCNLVASMTLDGRARIPGCPEVPPETCIRAYQRLGLVTVLIQRLQAFRSLIGDRCDDFTALVQYNDAAEVTVAALKAFLGAQPLGGDCSISGPIAAVQELLVEDNQLAAVLAIAGTAGIYPCARDRDVGRKNLRCKEFRGVLLSVSRALAAGLASADKDAQRVCQAARRQFTKVLNAQLDRVCNVLCLTTDGGESGNAPLLPL